VDNVKGAPSVTSYQVGSVVYVKESKLLLVRCADGWVGVKTVRVQYKRDVSATDFANGYKLRLGNHVFT
ncbi:hypothetical protein HDU93_005461, partial [Gonapodya sp. JEL0774]